MDEKQVEKLIEAAEYCKSIGSLPEDGCDCRKCFVKYGECMTRDLDEDHVVAVKSYYEAKLKALDAEMLTKAIKNAECARNAARRNMQNAF